MSQTLEAVFKQEGLSIDYTPIAAVAAGEVVVLNSLVGVAKQPIAAGAKGSLALTGVYSFTKKSGDTFAAAPRSTGMPGYKFGLLDQDREQAHLRPETPERARAVYQPPGAHLPRGAMIDFRIKNRFFNRQEVIDALGRANAKALSKAGAFIQRRAKSSIRKRKRVSRPGEPPSSHVGTLRNLIFFGYDVRQRSVVVGPTPVGAVGIVPPTLEYGGPIPVRRNPRCRRHKVGGPGEIRLRGKKAVYAKLVSAAQAERANRLNEELYGPDTIGGGQIAPRPFMGPALKAEMPNLPRLWANSVH